MISLLSMDENVNLGHIFLKKIKEDLFFDSDQFFFVAKSLHNLVISQLSLGMV